MIVGSGKVDRHESTSADLTFSGKDEALFDQLRDVAVAQGFATFQYDKRGVLDSHGNVNPETWVTADRAHLVSDAVDAAETLLSETSAQILDLILLGHSEGTIIATEVAIKLGGTVRALLLFGAQARSMKDMLHYQMVESRSKQTSGTGSVGTPEEEFQKALDMIASHTDPLAPDGKPIEWYRQHLAAPSNADQMKLVDGKKFIFQGEIDPQTPLAEVDLFRIAGVENLSVHTFQGIGHGFSPDKNGRPTLGPIDRAVLEKFAVILREL